MGLWDWGPGLEQGWVLGWTLKIRVRGSCRVGSRDAHPCLQGPSQMQVVRGNPTAHNSGSVGGVKPLSLVAARLKAGSPDPQTPGSAGDAYRREQQPSRVALHFLQRHHQSSFLHTLPRNASGGCFTQDASRIPAHVNMRCVHLATQFPWKHEQRAHSTLHRHGDETTRGRQNQRRQTSDAPTTLEALHVAALSPNNRTESRQKHAVPCP